MKKRDYRLTVDGKYNMIAIMQRAWSYMRQNKSIKWYTFKHALSESWADAKVKMEEKTNVRETPFNENLSLSDLYFNPGGNLANGNVCR